MAKRKVAVAASRKSGSRPRPAPLVKTRGKPVSAEVITCLTYSGGCAAAAKLYTSLFADGEILEMSQWQADSPVEEGQVMHCVFRIGGMTYRAFDGGSDFAFAMGTSISCTVDTQAEIDHLWNSLLANGGTESRCGWLIDRWGMWWQIVPSKIGMYISDHEHGDAAAGMKAMLTMGKLDIAKLEAAYHGKKRK
jgi:predicted 3-demethylubiquinone-9 3-methyltransferase (glyoxalase superfamily)